VCQFYVTVNVRKCHPFVMDLVWTNENGIFSGTEWPLIRYAVLFIKDALAADSVLLVGDTVKGALICQRPLSLFFTIYDHKFGIKKLRRTYDYKFIITKL